jgi:hypothetical protein
VVDVGRWLVEARLQMDQAEAVWLERLAQFDRDGLWALDGQFSCAAWLVWRTNMAHSTAFEKLRVRDRPLPVDESSRADCGDGEAPAEEPNRAAKKADAFMDLVRTALNHADGGRAAGDDRYMVHVVARHEDGRVSFPNGSPLHPGDAAMVMCDASTVNHTVTEAGEPLNLGRKTREWNTAQRRAITVRDGGHCRFPGCEFRHCEIHHMRPWENGGATNIGNGYLDCPRHHHMNHHGYRVEGDPNGELRFYRPDGTYLDSTYPVAARQPAGV